MNINDKTVLVTGAGRRLGRAISLHLAKLGANIIVHYNRSEREALSLCDEISAMKRKSFLIKADLLNENEINQMFSRISDETGTLHVLVNSAGVFKKTSIDSLTASDLDFHINTNLKAPYLCSFLANKLMKKAGNGRIINLADTAAFRPYAGYIPYCISKAGLIMLTRASALAFAPNVLVNAIAPSFVLFRVDENEEEKEKIIRKIPLKKIGTPEDVAKATAFLIESDFITGEIISVDGGYSI